MVDNKVNSNNEARRDLNRPDRVPFDRGGRLLSPTRVDSKSPFEKLLDKMDESSSHPDQSPYTPNQSASEVREAVRPVLSQQERYGRDKDAFEKKMTERETDKEEGKSNTAHEPGVARAREADRRVISRGGLGQKNQGHGERGGQKEGGFGQGKKGKHFAFAADLKGVRRGKIGTATPSRFALPTKETAAGKTALSQTKSKTLNQLNKALLDQLVRYCRLVTKTDGDKELDMQLHEEVFKGLKLKVAMMNGKLELTLTTASEEIQDFFQAQKGDLHQALSEKGIDVQTINVIMV